MNSADIPTELLPGTELKRGYRIVRTLGKGGMGRVYEAEYTALRRTRALKQTFYNNEQEREWLRREAELLSRLEDEHLPRVYDFFEEAGDYYLAMQFIAGPTLKNIVDKVGPLPPRAVLLVADQLLLTLGRLHTQSPPIIHRDIKPENIKVGDKVFLLDFGLAKDKATGTLVYARSPGYSSPEQESRQRTDERSDIYSLGATLYNLLTAVQPPVALERLRALSEGEADPLWPAQEFNHEISGSLAAIIHKAMALQPEDRYAGAAEMRLALKGEGIETIPTTLENAGWVEVTRQFQGEDETQQAALTEPQVRQPRSALFALCGLVMIALAAGGGYWLWASLSARQQGYDFSDRVVSIDQKFDVDIHPSLPPYTFHLAGYGNTTGGVPLQVGISEKGSPRYIQFLRDSSLVVNTALHPNAGGGTLDRDFSANDLFKFGDLNFDGYADMCFTYDTASVGAFDACWLFDTSSKAFEHSEQLAGILDGYCNITADPEARVLVVQQCHTLHARQTDPCLPETTEKTYRWENEELSLIRDTANDIVRTENGCGD